MVYYLQFDQIIGLPEFNALIHSNSRVRFLALYVYQRMLLDTSRQNKVGRFGYDAERPYSTSMICGMYGVKNYNSLRMALHLLRDVGLIHVKKHVIYLNYLELVTTKVAANPPKLAPPVDHEQPPFKTKQIYPVAKIKRSPEIEKAAQQVILDLGRKTNRQYLQDGPNLAHVLFWLQQGYTMQQLQAVIDVKVKEWLPLTNMQRYLRPTTLFGEKFTTYLEQIIVQPQRPDLPKIGREQALRSICRGCQLDVPAILKRAAKEGIATTEQEVTTLVQGYRK